MICADCARSPRPEPQPRAAMPDAAPRGPRRSPVTGLIALLLLGGGRLRGCGGTAAPAQPSVRAGASTLTAAPQAHGALATSSAPPPPTGGVQPVAGKPSPARAGPPRPAIIQSPIPFGARRKAEMTEYAIRHYGLHTYHLINPHV